MSLLPVTTTDLFIGRPQVVDESIPRSFSRISAREKVVQPTTTVVINLPKTNGLITNPVLEFDLMMTFPNVFQPPHVGVTARQAIWGAPSVETAIYLNEYYGNTQQAFETGWSNGTAYAFAPHTLGGYARLFETITLQDKQGRIIDQLNFTDARDYNLAQIMTLPHDKAVLYDQQMGTNVYQFSNQQPNLSRPLGVNATQFVNTYKESEDSKTITFTKHVAMPVPLYFGPNWPLAQMGDVDLVLKMNPASTGIFTAPPQHFSGFMDVRSQYQLSKTAMGNATAGNVASYIISPGVNFNGGTSAPQTAGMGSTLNLNLTGLILDTSDLEALLGPESLQRPSVWSTMDQATKTVEYPASHIMSTGFAFNVKIAQIDLPLLDPALLQAAFGQNVTQEQIDQVYGMIGTPLLRDVTVPIQVFASQISSISLLPPTPVPNIAANSSALCNAAITNALPSLDLRTGNQSTRGQVVIRFTENIAVQLPIWQMDASAMAFQTASGAMVRYPWKSDNPATPTFTDNMMAAVPVTSLWTPENLNIQIMYEITTNSSAKVGITSSTLPVDNCIVQAGAARSFPYGTVTQPDSWEIQNLALRIERPVLTPDLMKELDDAAGSTQGLRIRRLAHMNQYKNLSNGLSAEEWTINTTQAQLYALRWRLEFPPNDNIWGYEPFLSNGAFSRAGLTEASVALFFRNPVDLLCNLGGKFAWTVPNFSVNPGIVTSNFPNTYANICTRPKGAGGTPETFQLIASCFANSKGVSDSDLVPFSVNEAAASRLRLPMDVWYAANTLGGSAQIPRNLQLKFSFTPVTQIELAAANMTMTTDLVAKLPMYYTSNAGSVTYPYITGLGVDAQLLAPSVYGPSVTGQVCLTVYFPREWVFSRGSLGTGDLPLLSIYE